MPMNLHVNSNLALELPPASGHKPATSDPRAELAVQFIPSGARVLDLGGNPGLQALLPVGCEYADGRTGRKNRSRMPALSLHEFPSGAAKQSDLIVILGLLERVADVEGLFAKLGSCERDLILTYCPTDLSKGSDRAALGFVNHMSLCDLALLFDRHGFRIESTAPVDASQILMRLTSAERPAPITSCKVAVISADGTADLGARLGRQMINALLPGECMVDHLSAGSLEKARQRYDLVILGTGAGLFPPLLGDKVIDVMSRARAAIGIFGTQGRQLISRPTFDRILDRLDTWFARYQDDVL